MGSRNATSQKVGELGLGPANPEILTFIYVLGPYGGDGSGGRNHSSPTINRTYVEGRERLTTFTERTKL